MEAERLVKLTALEEVQTMQLTFESIRQRRMVSSVAPR